MIVANSGRAEKTLKRLTFFMMTRDHRAEAMV